MSTAWIPTVGDRAKARYMASSMGSVGTRWFQAIVTAVHADGCCDVEYDDGDKEARVLPKFLKASSAPLPTKPEPAGPSAHNSEAPDETCVDATSTEAATPAGERGAPAAVNVPAVNADVHATEVDEPGGVSVTEAEGFVLHLSCKSHTGYRGVQARNTSSRNAGFIAMSGGQYLGYFGTKVDAAVAYARHVQSLAVKIDELAGATNSDDGDTPNVGGAVTPRRRRFWTSLEHERLLSAARDAGWEKVADMVRHVEQYGWKAVMGLAQHVRTRTPDQVRIHVLKMFKRYAEEQQMTSNRQMTCSNQQMTCKHCQKAFNSRQGLMGHQRSCTANTMAEAEFAAEAAKEAAAAQAQAALEGLPLILSYLILSYLILSYLI